MKQISNYKAWAFLYRHATYHNVAVSTNRHIHPQAYTEKRTLHTLGGQQTFLCSGRTMRKLIQLGLHAAQCMECDERNACQHIRNTGILGTTGTSRRQVRLLTSAVSIKSGTAKQCETYLPLVCHLEERKQSLHARMDENRF